MNYYYNHHCY